MPDRRRRAARQRIERDTLGTLPVPADAYYGIQTRRAMLNFPISGRRLPSVFIRAYAHIKRAAADVNASLGLLDRRRAAAVHRAASEIIAGRHAEHFVVDVYQAGAGTSQNMNVNEVIANRAIEILGGRRGDYGVVHPNDHVNMGQSTNDTFPTAMRLAILFTLPGLRRSLRDCEAALRGLSGRFRRTVKTARTHLQDAVPIMLGQEFGAYASIVGRATLRLDEAARPLHRLNLGATAAGTGLNAHPRFARSVARRLSLDTGLRLRPAENLVEASMSTADFVHVSSSLRGLALDLGKIADDLRLLSSGPTAGLAEIALPAVQPGSSIMPGKVNPVMCEMLNMVCFQVAGCDRTIAAAGAAGQLELNVMMPVMAHNLLEAMSLLQAAVAAFTGKCLGGLRADAERSRRYFERSPSIATALTPLIGYARAAELAKESLRTGRTIVELVLERGVLDERTARRALDPARLTRPGVLEAAPGRGLRIRRGAGRSVRARRG
jgi:fumarate hydratase class II